MVDIIDCPPVSDLQGWLEEAANPSTVHETAFTVETHIVLHSKQLLIMSLKSLRCLSLLSTCRCLSTRFCYAFAVVIHVPLHGKQLLIMSLKLFEVVVVFVIVEHLLPNIQILGILSWIATNIPVTKFYYIWVLAGRKNVQTLRKVIVRVRLQPGSVMDVLGTHQT